MKKPLKLLLPQICRTNLKHPSDKYSLINIDKPSVALTTDIFVLQQIDFGTNNFDFKCVNFIILTPSVHSIEKCMYHNIFWQIYFFKLDVHEYLLINLY